MTRTRFILLSSLAVPAVLLAAPDIPWYTIDGGGVISSSGGNLRLSGTIGQADASAVSAMTGGAYELTGGFWVVTIPSCTTFVAADFDHNCVVDAADIAIFEACATGAGLPYDAANLPPGCTLTPDGANHVAADFDADGDVDTSDFGILQRCYSGSYWPADPNCAS